MGRLSDSGVTHHGVCLRQVSHQQDRAQDVIDGQSDLNDGYGSDFPDQLGGPAPGDQDIKALVHMLQGQLGPVLQVSRVDNHFYIFVFCRLCDHGVF